MARQTPDFTNFSEDKMGFPPTTPLNHKYGKKHSGDEPSYAVHHTKHFESDETSFTRHH